MHIYEFEPDFTKKFQGIIIYYWKCCKLTWDTKEVITDINL